MCFMIVPLIWCEREKGSDSILTLPDYRGGGLHRFGRVIRVLKAAPTLMEFEIACQSNCEDFLRVVFAINSPIRLGYSQYRPR